MKTKDEKWAVFWCGLLHPILFDELEASDTNRYLKALAQKEVVFPDGRAGKPSLSTLRRKLNRYRQKGFAALARQPRYREGIVLRDPILDPDLTVRQTFESAFAKNQILLREFEDRSKRSQAFLYPAFLLGTQLRGYSFKITLNPWNQ